MKKNNKNNEKGDNARDDKIVVNCVVIDTMPSTLFKLRIIETESEIIASLGGKLRQNKIRIIVGDNVTCEVSPYDLTRGRVVWRNPS